jgi:putative ABC transport system permease protein
MSNLSYALRLLRRSPLFTTIAVLTLALGIGANTAMFSVINAVLLRPLPYPEPDRLVHVWKTGRSVGVTDTMSYPDFKDYRERLRSVEALGIYRYWLFTLAEGDRPESLLGITTSPSLFDVLKTRPHLGRTFAPGDDDPGRNHIVILSFSLWHRRFHEDPAMIGRSVKLDGKPMTVVGVMPPGFTFPMTTPTTGYLATKAMEFWVPMPPDQQIDRRGSHSFWVVGRLAPGVSLEQARADASRIGAQLATEHPDTNRGTSGDVTPLDAHLVRRARTGLLALTAAIGFVLMIACVNITNLTLARSTTRERELAIRAALGASGGRLTRQLLCESLTVAVIGGAAGVLLARWSLPLIVALAPEVPRLQEASIDWRVGGFLLIVSIAAGTLVGVLPAWRASRAELTSMIRRTASGSGGSGPLPALVVAEIALSMLLLTGAGLLLRSFVNLLNVELGFKPDGVVTGWVMRPTSTFGDFPAQARFFDQVMTGLEKLPGVAAVGAVNALPLTLVNDSTGVEAPGIEGRVGMDRRKVTPDYFRTLGIELRSGRLFSAGDTSESPPVVILSRRAADRLWPDASAIGRRISFDGGDGRRLSWEVVGIVDDVRHLGVDVPPRETLYVPLAQAPEPFMQLAMRAAGGPVAVTTALSRVVASIDPEQAVFNVAPFDDLVAGAIGQRRFHATVVGVFAALSLVLAAVGIYGVVAYTVSRRGREIGIRLALGAAPRTVLGSFLRQGLRWVALGALLGLAASVGSARLLSSMLFDVAAADPAVLTSMTALLVVVAALAIYVPARRTLAIDPVEALRDL